MTNAEISEQLALLGKLMDIHGMEPEQTKILGAAAFTVDKLDQPLAKEPRERIGKIRGLWGRTSERILEIIDHGQLSELDTLIKSTPPGVLEMLQIKGLGPKKIKIVWKEMGIESLGELLYACQENRLTLYKGFGAKTQLNIQEAIEYYMQHQGHFLWADVEALFPQIEGYLQKCFGIDQVAVTGSYRRQDPTIEELSFVIRADIETIKKAFQTAQPPTILEETTHHIRYQLTNGLRLQLFPASAGQFAHRLFSTTAEPTFLESIPNWANTKPNATSEADLFERIGIPYLPPALRSDPIWLDPTRIGSTQRLIQPEDIRGIIHSHSKWSDGSNTIEEMAQEAIRTGFEYLVISDHSRSAFYANGLSDDRIHQQQQEIDSLNQRIRQQHPDKTFQLFKSIEADILSDGQLDYPDEILKTFDLVIASVHSQLTMTEEKAMSRLIRAIENPYTTILGHPTGRLLLSRKGYPIDHKKIIDACIANNVVIELNAHPRRLDIDWKWIPYILDKGGWISINPDAHELAGFNDIKYGVLVAQKGGLTPDRNLSSLPLSGFQAFI
ncbi:MAG: helix-hairpin-helix domain-containing protein [Bacteroidota bacterium]